MIHLHTRSVCDECGDAPAVVQIVDMFFLCTSCVAMVSNSFTSGDLTSLDVNATTGLGGNAPAASSASVVACNSDPVSSPIPPAPVHSAPSPDPGAAPLLSSAEWSSRATVAEVLRPAFDGCGKDLQSHSGEIPELGTTSDDLDATISELEASWRAEMGSPFFMARNSRTLRVVASSEISSAVSPN